MNMLHRICWRQFPRSIETIATSSNTFLAEQLSNRSLIRVKGNDVVPFLQGLVTNDMNHLHIDGLPSMFTMFLNNAGRVLYDSIIYKTADADTFLIECDREASSDLQKHLRIYRVRRKIDIECANSQYTPWILYNPIDSAKVPKPIEAKPDKVLCTVDPRLKELGVRVIQPKSNELQDIANLFPNAVVEPSTLCGYKSHRYIYGVGEGVTDHPPGKAFPLESNCDFLNGVSFHKGCYVGQELTARVYHTGVVRKRLMPLKLSSDFDPNATTVKTEAGAVVGTVRGASQRNALALLRVDQILKATELKIGEELCEVIKPHWWPSDLSNRQSMRKD